MCERRIITCEDCGGRGGFCPTYHDDEYGIYTLDTWMICQSCAGRGSHEIPVTPITQADLTANYPPWDQPLAITVEEHEALRELMNQPIAPGANFTTHEPGPYIVEDDSE